MARFRALMETRLAENPMGETPEYNVYPPNLKEPYRSRRFGIGQAMYEKLGIPREDKLARLQWLQSNDRFFGAPAAAFCFTDRIMGPPQWSDLGMLLQTAMLLFQEAGLGTCPQEAWSRWPKTVADFVGAPPELMLFCGLAIGHPDRSAPVNTLVSARAPMEEVLSLRPLFRAGGWGGDAKPPQRFLLKGLLCCRSCTHPSIYPAALLCRIASARPP
jgi:hypothetical protein